MSVDVADKLALLLTDDVGIFCRNMNVRYLDDWAYQANARMTTYQKLIWPQYWPNSGLNDEQRGAAEQFITREIEKVAEPYMGKAVEEYRFTLPWSRMFEVDVEKK